MTLSVSKGMAILAIICFVPAAFGYDVVGPVHTVPAGLAFLAAGHLAL